MTATVYVTKDFGFLRGEIYYADLDPHYGSEQGGKRPVIVIQNNTGNKFAPTVIEVDNINKNAYSSLSPAVPPDVFSIDATALKLISILFDNNLISAEVYHQVLSRYSA